MLDADARFMWTVCAADEKWPYHDVKVILVYNSVHNMAQKIVLFGSLLFVGLTAGAAYVVWFDYNPVGMSSSLYVQHMQHAIRVLTIPLPSRPVSPFW